MAAHRTTIILLATVAALLPLAEPAHILAVFPHIGKSHFFMFKPFVYKLAELGHTITVITHFPDDNPPKNVDFISLRRPEDEVFFNSFNVSMLDGVPGGLAPFFSVYGLREMGIDVCRKGLPHPNIKSLLKSNKKFDLLILEFFNTDCFACLAHIYKTPIIGIFSSAMMPWHNDRFGNPDNPSYIVNHFLQFPSKMSLLQRIGNAIATFGFKAVYSWSFQSTADALVREHIRGDIPPVEDIVKNSSLFLINSHFSLFQPRPLVPGIVEIGGFHVTKADTKSIPADLLKKIREAPHGVIFFSLGSTIRGSTIPEAKLRVFQKALGKRKELVLWKWEEDTMPGKPDNVIIGKWFPQNDILGLPEVKLFITHSGLMGTEEAIFHGVPMLMLPFFGDQGLNAASAAEKGVGVVLDYYSLTEEDLSEGLRTVLEDKTYADNAKRLAKIFLDRPLSIMDTAIYWTEYVIRHGGAPHLRSAAADLSWFQLALLDVFFTIVALLAVIFTCFRALCCRNRGKQTKVKQKKQ